MSFFFFFLLFKLGYLFYSCFIYCSFSTDKNVAELRSSNFTNMSKTWSPSAAISQTTFKAVQGRENDLRLIWTAYIIKKKINHTSLSVFIFLKLHYSACYQKASICLCCSKVQVGTRLPETEYMLDVQQKSEEGYEKFPLLVLYIYTSYIFTRNSSVYIL